MELEKKGQGTLSYSSDKSAEPRKNAAITGYSTTYLCRNIECYDRSMSVLVIDKEVGCEADAEM